MESQANVQVKDKIQKLGSNIKLVNLKPRKVIVGTSLPGLESVYPMPCKGTQRYILNRESLGVAGNYELGKTKTKTKTKKIQNKCNQ